MTIWTPPVDRNPGYLTDDTVDWDRAQSNQRFLFDAVNRLFLPAPVFKSNDGVATLISLSGGMHWNFPHDGAKRHVITAVPKPSTWDAGKVGIRAHLAPDGTSGGTWRFRCRIGTVIPASQELDNDTQKFDITHNVTASSTQYRPTEDLVAVAGTSLVDADDLLLIRVSRIGDDAGDTNTDAMLFSGLEIFYEAD
jgi:hypothetical protein